MSETLHTQVYESVSQKGKKSSKRILLWLFWDILVDNFICEVIVAGREAKKRVWSWQFKN